MLFTSDAVPGLAAGTITLTFRNWTRAQARVGGRYRTGGLLLEVLAVSRVAPDSITDAEARRAGSPSANALRQRFENEGTTAASGVSNSDALARMTASLAGTTRA